RRDRPVAGHAANPVVLHVADVERAARTLRYSVRVVQMRRGGNATIARITCHTHAGEGRNSCRRKAGFCGEQQRNPEQKSNGWDFDGRFRQVHDAVIRNPTGKGTVYCPSREVRMTLALSPPSGQSRKADKPALPHRQSAANDSPSPGGAGRGGAGVRASPDIMLFFRLVAFCTPPGRGNAIACLSNFGCYSRLWASDSFHCSSKNPASTTSPATP